MEGKTEVWCGGAMGGSDRAKERQRERRDDSPLLCGRLSGMWDTHHARVGGMHTSRRARGIHDRWLGEEQDEAVQTRR
jgi:hypothetical protein